ncbi:class I SAM-dependent methyltransferase [Lachnospiraceae bacterium 56-18]|jgi:2-polyprenyl-3-methyl-5-hydroxy-6-metoxy-1,4-benzoquinol methylase
MGINVEQFRKLVSCKNKLQSKYLKKWEISDKEKEDLEAVLGFFIKNCGYSLEFLVDSYLFVNSMIMEEQRFFLKNGHYRNKSFTEVNQQVYQNKEYMSKYMCGLTLTDYIWINHIKLLRFFEDKISAVSGKKYLEIGPGFGQYLIKSMIRAGFNEYTAIDISETSVRSCMEYLKYQNIKSDKIRILTRDFMEYSSEEKFDCIVMGEVLEHLEDPELALEKIFCLLEKRGCLFVTTAVNAPTIDHIYLFRSVGEVLDIINNAGFKVMDYLCVAAGDVSIEKAEKQKRTINIALMLNKSETFT